MGIKRSMTGVAWHIESNYRVNEKRTACANCEFYRDHVCCKYGFTIQCNNAPICRDYHNINTDERHEYKPVQKAKQKNTKSGKGSATTTVADLYKSKQIVKYYCRSKEEFIRFRKYKVRVIDFVAEKGIKYAIDLSKLIYAKIIYQKESVHFEIDHEESWYHSDGHMHIKLGSLWVNPGINIKLEKIQSFADKQIAIEKITNVIKAGKRSAHVTKASVGKNSRSSSKGTSYKESCHYHNKPKPKKRKPKTPQEKALKKAKMHGKLVS